MIEMKKSVIRVLAFAAALLALPLFCLTASSAKLPSPARDFYVYDEANVLRLSTEDHIITVNEELYARCGAQIVIVCVKTTGDADIADYAYRLFNKWAIGSDKENNGVLVLMSVEENDYYALQGKGLENLLSSGTLKVMLDKYLEPYFAVGDYDGGALAIFDSLVRFIEEIYPAEETVYSSTTEIELSDEDDLFDLIDEFPENVFSLLEGVSIFGLMGSIISAVMSFIFDHLFLVIVILIVIAILRKKRRRGGGGSSRG